MPHAIYVIDGKHFWVWSTNPLEWSHKTNKHARNGLCIINRANSKFIHYEMNFPATYHDVWCLQNSKLLQDPNYVELFDRNTFIADSGFPGFRNILYPRYTSRNEEWERLPREEKEYYKTISRIEKEIERVFGNTFFQKYSICRAVDSNDMTRLHHTSIYLAAMLLHNLEVEWNEYSILDGPLSRLARFLAPVDF